MSLLNFKAKNRPQQLGLFGANHAVDDRGLPPEVFAKLQERFAFTVDVAASDKNAKLPKYYTIENSGLLAEWRGERVYCNPPYSDIEPWLRKAWYESMLCPLVVMLLPANRTEQGWWQTHIEPRRDRPGSGLTVEFLAGRQRFIAQGKEKVGPNERPPFGCCLCIFDRSKT